MLHEIPPVSTILQVHIPRRLIQGRRSVAEQVGPHVASNCNWMYVVAESTSAGVVLVDLYAD